MSLFASNDRLDHGETHLGERETALPRRPVDSLERRRPHGPADGGGDHPGRDLQVETDG